MKECDEIEFTGSSVRVRIDDEWHPVFEVTMSIEGVFAKIVYPTETVKLKQRKTK